MTSQDWTRLGEAVVRERVRLGMRTTKALAERMGLTARIVGDIENGRRTSYSTGTKAALELALDWAEGSVDAVLAGGNSRSLTVREARGSDIRWASPSQVEAATGQPRPADLAEARAMLAATSRELQSAMEQWAFALSRASEAQAELAAAADKRRRLADEQYRLNLLIDELTHAQDEESDGDRREPAASDLGGAPQGAGVQVAQDVDAGVDVPAVTPDGLALAARSGPNRGKAIRADLDRQQEAPESTGPEEGV